jgi:hypothetical protein
MYSCSTLFSRRCYENINLSEDEIGRPPLCSMKQTLVSVICRPHRMSAVYIPTVRLNHNVHGLIEVFNSSEKNFMLCLLSCVINWIQYVSINLLISKGDGYIYVIIIIISSMFVLDHVYRTCSHCYCNLSFCTFLAHSKFYR